MQCEHRAAHYFSVDGPRPVAKAGGCVESLSIFRERVLLARRGIDSAPADFEDFVLIESRCVSQRGSVCVGSPTLSVGSKGPPANPAARRERVSLQSLSLSETGL